MGMIVGFLKRRSAAQVALEHRDVPRIILRATSRTTRCLGACARLFDGIQDGGTYSGPLSAGSEHGNSVFRRVARQSGPRRDARFDHIRASRSGSDPRRSSRACERVLSSTSSSTQRGIGRWMRAKLISSCSFYRANGTKMRRPWSWRWSDLSQPRTPGSRSSPRVSHGPS